MKIPYIKICKSKNNRGYFVFVRTSNNLNGFWDYSAQGKYFSTEQGCIASCSGYEGFNMYDHDEKSFTTWKTEHPKSEVPQEIYTHTSLNDISWKNDASPSFEFLDSQGETTGHHIWVDYEDVQMRDVKEYSRYSIVHCDNDDDIKTVLDTDDLNEVLNFLKTLKESSK